jgi:hypothetical protein
MTIERCAATLGLDALPSSQRPQPSETHLSTHPDEELMTMPDVVLFTKPECKNCDYVKGKIPEGLEMRILDITTKEGMAEFAYHELVEQHTPVLVVDGEIVQGTVAIKNRMAELAGVKG